MKMGSSVSSTIGITAIRGGRRAGGGVQRAGFLDRHSPKPEAAIHARGRTARREQDLPWELLVVLRLDLGTDRIVPGHGAEVIEAARQSLDLVRRIDVEGVLIV